MKYQNPVLKGFNPDPSVCRVGNDYYMVCSSFEFYPGVPIYHSRNLVNWELINHCLKTPEQLPLGNCRSSHGIYAPTIRYNNGTFYMTTTNVGSVGHIIVHTSDVRGDWSSPVYVNQEGIDPSLFFEGKKVYFTSTSFDENGKQGIGMCEIDIETGEKLTETTIISYGTGGKYCEAPHIYKIGNFYYLLTAEGGTEMGHFAALLRSRYIYGPYEMSPHGPVISHKERSDTTLQGTGHADLFQDQQTNWWLVCLAFRQIPSTQLHHLGRETCLAPVRMTDDGWFVVSDQGYIEYSMEAQLPEDVEERVTSFYDDFSSSTMKLDWTFVREPKIFNYRLSEGLCLIGNESTLNDYNPTFLGIRQKEFNMTAKTMLAFLSDRDGRAGITVYYSKEYHYDLSIEKNDEKCYCVLSLTMHNMSFEKRRVELTWRETYELIVVAGEQEYEFIVKMEDHVLSLGTLPTAGLCTEGTMFTSFTGTFIGLFAETCDVKFDFFSCDV